MSTDRPQARVGGRIEDLCRTCKLDREHVVMAVGEGGRPLRVVCDYCGSQHNYRGGARQDASAGAARKHALVSAQQPFDLVSERERSGNTMSDLELLLRRIIREESGLTAVTPADKWRGGELVLRPGREGLQEKTLPIETFFHKIVMLRNRLRTLEQQVNASDLPQEAKIKIQSYVTGCYGSLTSFNILFAEEEDRFRGSGGGDD